MNKPTHNLWPTRSEIIVNRWPSREAIDAASEHAWRELQRGGIEHPGFVEGYRAGMDSMRESFLTYCEATDAQVAAAREVFKKKGLADYLDGAPDTSTTSTARAFASTAPSTGAALPSG